MQRLEDQARAIRTLADIVRTHAAVRPDKVALVAGDERLTYGALYERACRTADAMREAGVRSGDRVAYIGRNASEYFDVMFGSALLGGVLVAVNWRLSAREAVAIVDDAEAAVVVAGEGMGELVDGLVARLTGSTKLLVVGGHDGLDDFRAWRDARPATDPLVATDGDDVCFQLYSSGTTGMPKGVMLTSGSLFDNAGESSSSLGLGPDCVGLVALPLFHIVGTGWSLGTLYHGGTAVLLQDADPAAIVAAITEHRITHAMMVPAVLQFILELPGVENVDFSSLDLIMYGASPISEQVLTRSVSLLGCRFAQGYGLTETAGGVVTLPPEDHDPNGPNAHRLRAAGKANPNVELRIVDPTTDTTCPTGAVGEIWVRTNQTMVGYWKQPEATAEALSPDGWFRTGDAGYLDADGYLYIHDRVKDMIVSGAENIYPAEVESVLMGHPEVADVAVIGVPSEKWGETPKAIVVRREGATLTDAELIAYCRDNLAHFKCPTSVDFVASIPRNPTGKILKKELRAPFWKDATRAVN